MSKPFSQACENNKAFILDIISRYFKAGSTVLEIGSYTAQHARYFAEHLPKVSWMPTEIESNFAVLRAGLETDLAGSVPGNIAPPFVLEVQMPQWPVQETENIFSANTLHIMAEKYVSEFFRGVGEVLKPGGHLCVYGPFKYNGAFTSDSNARFQEWLEAQDPVSGIRDFELVNALAEKAGLFLVEDHPMPANNQLLVWQKS